MIKTLERSKFPKLCKCFTFGQNEIQQAIEKIQSEFHRHEYIINGNFLLTAITKDNTIISREIEKGTLENGVLMLHVTNTNFTPDEVETVAFYTKK